MKIIGITGGVGSGKSKVLEYLRMEYGAVVCQADEVAKQLQKAGKPCHREIVAQFGQEILNPDGELDRMRLAEIVFSDAGQLQALNQIVHPAVRHFLEREISRHRAAGTRYFVIEAALLLENDYDEICDEIWYIHTSESVRRRRLKASRGYDEAKISRIIASQLPEKEFLNRCDAIIENSGDFRETEKQIGEVLG